MVIAWRLEFYFVRVPLLPRRKFDLFLTLFLVFALSDLFLVSLFPHSSLAQAANIFHSVWANFIVLAISLLLIAFGLSELIDLFHRRDY
jgi:hypothetical protein